MGLYDILKASELGAGAAPDMYTALLAQKINKGSSGGEAELSGVPPLTFTADGTPLIDLLISGNEEHSGTPTSDNPIMPLGTGERTAQIIPYPYYQPDAKLQGVTWTTSSDGKIIGSGTTTGGTNFVLSTNLALPVGMYTLQVIGKQSGMSLMLYDTTASVLLARIDATETTSSVTFEIAQTGAHRLYFNTGYADRNVNIDCFVMLNSGSTALPHKPYGFEISISSASTTTPIYLGEVETTRRIRKLVFDGSENWRQSSDGNIYIALSPNQGVAWTRVLSTHFTSSQVQTNGGLLWFVNAAVDFDTVEEYKTYLAAQYAAGTPVCVWYVLATPQTAVVNEPLMKIGDYADTLSKEQAGANIPTNNGSTTVDVDTTVKPSEVYIKYRT